MKNDHGGMPCPANRRTAPVAVPADYDPTGEDGYRPGTKDVISEAVGAGLIDEDDWNAIAERAKTVPTLWAAVLGNLGRPSFHALRTRCLVSASCWQVNPPDRSMSVRPVNVVPGAGPRHGTFIAVLT